MNIGSSIKWTVLSILATLILPAIAMGSNQQLEDKVVVYSTHGESLLESVADAFEAETGTKVEFINLKGELADRVRAEKANPQADVMYGAPSSVYQELKAEGLFVPCSPSWADKINPLFKDKEGYWYGTIQTPVLMFYNRDMISKDQAPKIGGIWQTPNTRTRWFSEMHFPHLPAQLILLCCSNLKKKVTFRKAGSFSSR